MRQPLVTATGRDDAESGGSRPIHQIADQRGLVAVGEAVDHARFRRLAREQRAAERIGLDRDVDDVLAVAERGKAMLDRRRRVAGAFDHDVDARMRDQLLPVVADVRACPWRARRRTSAAANRSGFQPTRSRLVARIGRRQIGDRRPGARRRSSGPGPEYIAPNLPAPISPTRKRLALRRALLQLGVEVHAAAPFAVMRPAHGCSAGSRRAVLPRQRHVVLAQQAVVGQARDRREVAVRDVLRPLEPANVIRDRAQAQVHADPVPRRQVRRRRVHQAGVEQDHRAGRPLRRDDAAALDQLADRVVVDRPQRIAGRRRVVLRVEHAQLVAAGNEHQRSVELVRPRPERSPRSSRAARASGRRSSTSRSPGATARRRRRTPSCR